MQLTFIIGYGASMLSVLSNILKEESSNLNFEYLAINANNIDSVDEDLINKIQQSDIIFLYADAINERIEKAIKDSKARIIVSASDTLSYLSKGDISMLNKAIEYFKVGGEHNLRNLVRFLMKCMGYNIEVDEVKYIPWHGIYHPKLGLFTKTDEYLKIYDRRPLVGILIHRTYWLYGNLKHFNVLIEALECEGLGVLPVFTHGWKDPLLNTPSKEDTIKEFFIFNGKSVVDAVINLTYFFLLDHGKWWNEDVNVESYGVELLKKLNVPIIQPCFSSSQSVDEWLNSEQGLDYLSQVWTIVMPEVDGLIEPIYIAGSKEVGDIRPFEPYTEHARYIAKRVRKWIELRRKKLENRKIAIILINPPCKNLESSVAIGMGLDVPESVARLLNKLKKIGYKVDNPPKDGNELIKIILERKAISEFRWTSVEEIVLKGGAVDFVDLETYMSWFNELPESVKNEMIKTWGKPEDVLSGKVKKELVGMVYENKFVIPGIVFGNVFITPQPKFGCAGSRCDGKVCKILHDPKIPPPHQWLAVYRWITRVFKADVIIHFGTHGYLEFRPGKGVGLSINCWPEISIDDVPHVYVYNVSNPMEGVIAKRRGYALIVDHMYPPMAMADVLDELDSLISQYYKAKQAGDDVRARVIYKEIMKKARELNISGDVERIHRYVESIRNTQIEMGLHIFAHPRLMAEYIATIMANDTYDYPSIRRVIAEYIGLNYDEIRSKPNEINKFGLTNSEILSILHKIAVETIKELIEKNIDSDEEIIDILNKNISKILGGVTGGCSFGV